MKRSNSILRVAFYARVSSEKQAEAHTIASQVAELRRRIEQDGCTIQEDDGFVDDGVSGTILVRPALERLRDQVAHGALDRLYVLAPDRLARKASYQALLIDEFTHAGVEVVFLNHALGKSPEDDLLLQVQGVIAEYERAKIMERARRGKLHAARQGSVNVLVQAPFGYRYVTIAEGGGQARYEVVLEEARIVRQLFTWVGQEHRSLSEVCRRLETQRIPTRTGLHRWNSATVAALLKNPAFIGQATFGKTRVEPWRPPLRPRRGQPATPRRPYSVTRKDTQPLVIPVPALVSVELFEAANEQLADNRRRYRQSRRGASFLLQGLLVCPGCGYAWCGQPRSGQQRLRAHERPTGYYRCAGRMRAPPAVRGQTRLCGQADPHAGAGRGGVAGRLSTPSASPKARGGVPAPLAAAGGSVAHEQKPGLADHATEARDCSADRRLQRRAAGEGRVRAEDSAVEGAAGASGSRGKRLGAGGGPARRAAPADRPVSGLSPTVGPGSGGGGLVHAAGNHPGPGEAD